MVAAIDAYHAIFGVVYPLESLTLKAVGGTPAPHWKELNTRRRLGKVSTLILTESLNWHPFTSVTVTLYLEIGVVEGKGKIVCAVPRPEGDHV